MGGAAGSDGESQEEARGYAEELMEGTGWSPDRTVLVGGALAYTRYDILLCLLLKWISKRGRGSHGHESGPPKDGMGSVGCLRPGIRLQGTSPSERLEALFNE